MDEYTPKTIFRKQVDEIYLLHMNTSILYQEIHQQPEVISELLAAEIDFALGRHDAAFANLWSALKRQPKSLEANDTLAEFYRRLGRNDESDRQMSVSTNLVHTNAGWMLRSSEVTFPKLFVDGVGPHTGTYPAVRIAPMRTSDSKQLR